MNTAASLYPAHLAALREHADRALALGGFDHLLIAASTPLGRFLDDQDYPFVANPHFKHWLPLTDAPVSWRINTPGSRPKARSPDSIAARCMVSRLSSPIIAPTLPAMISSTSTGGPMRGPTATTSSDSRKNRTFAAGSSSTIPPR